MRNLSLLFIAFLLLQFNTLAQEGWFWQNPFPQGNNLNGICLTDANTGTAVGGDGTILRTTDGGANWMIQSSGTTYDLNAVCFTDVNTGTAVGDEGTIH